MQLMKDSTKGTAYVCLLTEYTTEQNRTEQNRTNETSGKYQFFTSFNLMCHF